MKKQNGCADENESVCVLLKLRTRERKERYRDQAWSCFDERCMENLLKEIG